MATPPDNSHITRADLEALEDRLTTRLTSTLEERLTARLTATFEERLDSGFKELREYIDERTHDAETRLLRAFWGLSTGPRHSFRPVKG